MRLFVRPFHLPYFSGLRDLREREADRPALVLHEKGAETMYDVIIIGAGVTGARNGTASAGRV